jgi:hypothetical protein
MKILQFKYEYGHVTRLEDNRGHGYYSQPVHAIGEQNYVVDNEHDYVKEMLWIEIQYHRIHLAVDPMFRRLGCEVLPIEIAGTFKPTQNYLRNS